MSKGSAVIVGLALFGGAFWLLNQQKKQTPHHNPFESMAQSLYQRVCSVFNMPSAPPLIADYTVSNAQSNGYNITYNPYWIESMVNRHCNNTECSQSFIMGVFAHEIAHHILQHAFKKQNRHQQELEADFMAGEALAALQVPANDFQRILGNLSQHGSPTHPAGIFRKQYIANGFRNYLRRTGQAWWLSFA